MSRVERIGGAELHLGDCREVLAGMPAASVDAVCTDPPAGISFMNSTWDHHKGGRDQWVAWMTEVAREAWRVCKPGAHAFVWTLPRTAHWTAWAWEDAGWEPRDCFLYLFGTGFPKSLDVSKAIDRAAGAEREVVGSKLGRPGMAKNGSNQSFDNLRRMEGREDRPNPAIDITAPATDAARQWAGWGTAAKPAHEDWWLFRKPLSEPTVAANVLRWSTGAINVDGCRIEAPDAPETASFSPKAQSRYVGILNGGELSMAEPRTTSASSGGRWPANVAHDGSPEVLEAFAAFGERASKRGPDSLATGKNSRRGVCYGNGLDRVNASHGDTGTAARFFYASKASKEDRCGSRHPCIKPVSLCRWLVRLITPPGGTVLDCFAGSGSIAAAALLEGFTTIAIEREEEYIRDIRARIARLHGTDTPLFKEAVNA